MELKLNISNDQEFKDEIRKAIMGEIRHLARAEGQSEFDQTVTKKLEDCMKSYNIQAAIDNAVRRLLPEITKNEINNALNQEANRMVNVHLTKLENHMNKLDDAVILDRVEKILKTKGISLI